MKLRKVNILTEEKDNNEIAFEEQEKFKKNREDVIKSRTPEKVEKTGDIENAIKNSKEILNTKVPAVNTKKNNFNILESLLNEGFDFDVKSKVFTVDVTNRTALKKLCECLNKINTGYLINRSTKEGYRYCVTIKESFKRRESINESKEVNESKEEIQAQINWCESALNNPNGRAAMDAKANYGSNWKKYVKADLEKFKKMLADSEKKDESLEENKKKLYYVVYKDENGVETVQEDGKGNTEFEDKDYADDMCTGFSERDTDAKGEYIVKSKDVDESLKEEAKGIEHNPEVEKKFVGLDECDKSVKEDICPECGKEPCVCGPATDKDAEYQKTFAKGQAEWDKEVEKELTGKDLDEDLKLLADINDYKPWLGAVDLWDEIVDADKVEELEFALEDLYPDGLTITELNDLLWFEQDFIREQIGLAKSEEDDDTVEESFEEKKQRIKESYNK